MPRYKRGVKKMSEISVDKDGIPGKDLAVNEIMCSALISRAKYALLHDSNFFGKRVSEETLNYFGKLYDLNMGKNKHEIQVDFQNGLLALVKSFTKPNKSYHVKFPFDLTGKEKVLEKIYSCECLESVYAGHDIQMGGCVHQDYSGVFFANNFGSGGFGLYEKNSSLNIPLGKIIRKIVVEYGRRLSNTEIYDNFPNEWREFNGYFKQALAKNSLRNEI